MAGVALGRLWDTHPRMACVFHALSGSVIGVVALTLWLSRDWGTAALITVLFAIDAAAFVIFTVDAVRHGWSRRTW